jgi:hypothetical protein
MFICKGLDGPQATLPSWHLVLEGSGPSSVYDMASMHLDILLALSTIQLIAFFFLILLLGGIYGIWTPVSATTPRCCKANSLCGKKSWGKSCFRVPGKFNGCKQRMTVEACDEIIIHFAAGCRTGITECYFLIETFPRQNMNEIIQRLISMAGRMLYDNSFA